MTTSNTKLTKEQKQELKNLKADFPNIQLISFPDEFATVAITEEFPGSKMVKVSVSYCSLQEKKFRAKVGEYQALNKMVYHAEYVKVPRSYGFYSIAYDFASMA